MRNIFSRGRAEKTDSRRSEIFLKTPLGENLLRDLLLFLQLAKEKKKAAVTTAPHFMSMPRSPAACWGPGKAQAETVQELRSVPPPSSHLPPCVHAHQRRHSSRHLFTKKVNFQGSWFCHYESWFTPQWCLCSVMGGKRPGSQAIYGRGVHACCPYQKTPNLPELYRNSNWIMSKSFWCVDSVSILGLCSLWAIIWQGSILIVSSLKITLQFLDNPLFIM